MSRGAKIVTVLIAIGCVVVGIPLALHLGAVAFTGEAATWTDRSTACVQPDDITYRDGRYAVFLRKPTFSLAFSTPPAAAVISREAGGNYGVYVELNPATDDGPLTCSWTAEAVTITEPNGISHTVPATVFTGGR